MSDNASDRGLLAAMSAIARRPHLWPVAVTTARSLVADRWWRRPPFLPVPDRKWLEFRMVTAYGGDGRHALHADDVMTFLEWRRTFPR